MGIETGISWCPRIRSVIAATWATILILPSSEALIVNP